ncbi:MAG TPA: hypothetical protein VKZ63_17565 [Kofleriaceae bacterium]|nr:hypothetical protein [Kofleriaceae bacterium]
MVGRFRVAAATLLVCTSSTAAADASSLTDYFGPREVALGESMRADARGALATTLNPAGLGLSRQLVFEGSYGYRPGDGASVISASACDSTVPIGGCFYYHYIGAEPTLSGETYDRRAHDFGIAAARAITPRILVGINARYFDYNSNLMGEADASGFAGDLGLIVRASESVHLAVVGYNLLAEDSPQYPMAVGGGVTVRPVPQLGIGLDAVWNLEVEEGRGTGRYGGGIEYFLQSADMLSGYPLRAGVVHDREVEGTYLTAGVGFTSAKVAVDLGARKQVGGGDELMVQGGLRLFGPTLP